MLHSCLHAPMCQDRRCVPWCLDAWGCQPPSFLMRASVVMYVYNVLFLTSLSSECNVRGSYDDLRSISID